MRSIRVIHESARKWIGSRLSRVSSLATRDGRLLLYIVGIVGVALTASFFTIRGAEHRLLKDEAQKTAVHWAQFLQSRLLALDEILAAGLVSEADRQIFDFASAAGGVRDYQIIRPDGIVALSSWSGDFRGAIDSETVLSVVREQHIVAQVAVDEVAGRALVIGQAYVPIEAESGQRGALKVDVDVTETAAHYRSLGNATFIMLLVLLAPPGWACGWLIKRNIRHRRQSEMLQRQRGHILEDLAKGVSLDSVLHGIAAFAEQHHPASRCSILLLNPSGRRVVNVVGGSGDVDYQIVGRDLEQLGETLAGVLRGEISSTINPAGGRWVWTLPLRTTTGVVQGAFSLTFETIQEAHGAAALGPAPTLAQLAATAIEYRRAQNALVDMRKRQDLILETAGDGIFGVNDDRQIVFANPACARMLRREPADMIGMDFNALFSSVEPEIETNGRFPNPIAETLERGVMRHSDRLQLLRSDGTGFFVELTATPVQQPTSNLRAVVVFHDISSQIFAEQQLFRAKEDAEMANRAKSGFLANMSHELRTPLNAIIGFSETIMQEVMGPIGNAHYREYAEHINLSGQHLLALINDLLDLSKIEAGKLELYETSFDIHAVLKDSQVLVSDGVQGKRLNLELDVSQDLTTVYGDEQKLKQVLVNLLSNAVKFTDEGGRISVSAWREGSDALRLSVADTGAGIAPEHLSKVMLPFGQANHAHNRDHKGTGLGLPLSKSLIELHGGTFWLESTLGAGTTVSIRLPGRARERAPGRPTAANPS